MGKPRSAAQIAAQRKAALASAEARRRRKAAGGGTPSKAGTNRTRVGKTKRKSGKKSKGLVHTRRALIKAITSRPRLKG